MFEEQIINDIPMVIEDEAIYVPVKEAIVNDVPLLNEDDDIMDRRGRS